MTGQRRRSTLGICVFCTTGLALLTVLFVARRSVSRAHGDLLREETGMAVELLRLAGDTAALGQVFGSRWRQSDVIIPLLEEAAVYDSAGGRVGAATVYDADSWYETGTLFLSDGKSTVGEFPVLVLAVAGFALIGLGFMAHAVTRSTTGLGFRRYAFPALAFTLLALPTGTAMKWSMDDLAEASVSRLSAASQVLRLAPDFDSLIAAPGGITHATGAYYVLSDPSGHVEFSTLPPAATSEMHNASFDGIARVTADRVAYLATDVGRVRLAVLPYDRILNPVPTACVLVFLGVLLAALPVALTGLVDRPRAYHRHVVAWSFLAPAAIHLAIFTIGPLVTAAWLSLHRWSLIDVAKPFVGLANYARLLGDAAYWNAIKNTVVFTLHVPASMAVALGLALLIQRRVRGVVFLRAMLFLPTITSLVAVAMVWQWMLHDEYGLLNWILSLVRLQPVHWLSSPSTALLSIMVMATWLVVGYQMILFQAGLAAIPSDLYDAARIDGAGPWKRFIHVTLPGLRHTLFFVLVTSVIGSFQVFGAVYVMTEGGPLHSTDVAVFHIYQEAWEFLRFGDAAAMSWLLFAIIFVATWLQFRTLERRVEVEP